MDLTFTDELDFYKISGKTFIWKEQIKSLGGKWNPEQKVWRIPRSTDISELKAAVLKKEVDICTELLLAAEKKTVKPHWLCCDNALIVDRVRQHTVCNACAVDGNNFRVRGAIFTGD
jgi:hypothetical protein